MKKWYFLRGLVRESGHWSDFISRFQARFPQDEVILLDLPGCGKLYQETCPTTIAGMVDRIRKDQNFSGGDSHLFAISLGAMVGVDWMYRYPDDFQSAILINTSLRGLNPFYERLLPRTYWPILKSFFSSPLEVEKTILRMTSNRPELYEKMAHEWEKIHYVRPVSRSNTIRQLLAAMKFFPPQKKPKAKLLLLNSLEDHLASPACSKKLSDFWDVPLIVHPTAGHDLTLDEPDWALDQTNKFST